MSVRERPKRTDQKKSLKNLKKGLDKPSKMCYNEYIKGREKAKNLQKKVLKNLKKGLDKWLNL